MESSRLFLIWIREFLGLFLGLWSALDAEIAFRDRILCGFLLSPFESLSFCLHFCRFFFVWLFVRESYCNPRQALQLFSWIFFSSQYLYRVPVLRGC